MLARVPRKLWRADTGACIVEHKFDRGRSKEIRHVVRSRKGGWNVLAPGVQRVNSQHDTQRAAIRAPEIVQNEGGGEFVIYDRCGLIRDSDTVASGPDPSPPRDRQ